jgi:hypothetical protein
VLFQSNRRRTSTRIAEIIKAINTQRSRVLPDSLFPMSRSGPTNQVAKGLLAAISIQIVGIHTAAEIPRAPRLSSPSRKSTNAEQSRSARDGGIG